MFGKIRNLIFGYDLSILLAGNQFEGYGEALANYFAQEDYRCLVQKVNGLIFKKGGITHAINGSTLLVVLATEEAIHSNFVEKTIESFIKQNKTVIAIDFGFLVDAQWYYLLKNQKKITEKSSFLDNANPSHAVIDVIANAVNFRVKNKILKQSNILSAILLLFSIFVIFGASYYIYHLSEELKNNRELVAASKIQVSTESEKAASAAKQANIKKEEAGYFKRLAFVSQMAAISNTNFPADPTRSLRFAQLGFNYLHPEKDSLPYSILSALFNNFYGCYSNNLGFYRQKVELNSDVNDFREIGMVKKILVANGDGKIRIVNDQGAIESAFHAHKGKVTQVTYSPQNQFILTTSEDNTAKLFTINGDLIQTLDDHHNDINLGLISPDGTRILTATDDTLRLWGIKGNIIGKYAIADKIVNHAVYSPVEGLIAASFGESIGLVNFQGNYLRQLDGHQDEIINLDFSKNGSRLLSTSYDSTAVIWAKDGEKIAQLKGHNGIVNVARFSSDRTRIITASDDQTAKLWDWNGAFIKTLSGHSAAVIDASFSQDSKYILTVSLDNSLKLWDNNGKHLKTFNGHKNTITKAKFTQDGQYIVSGSKDGTLIKWPVNMPMISSMEIHANGVKDITFTANEKQIWTVSGRGLLRFWDRKGKLINGDISKGAKVSQIFKSKENGTYAIIDGQIVKLNAAGSIVLTYAQLGNKISSMAVSQNEHIVAGLDQNHNLLTYNTLKDTVKLPDISDYKIQNIAFNKNVLLLATGKGLAKLGTSDRITLAGLNDQNIGQIIPGDSLNWGLAITSKGSLIQFDNNYNLTTTYPETYGSIVSAAIDHRHDLVYAGTKTGDLLVFKQKGQFVAKLNLHQKQINKIEVAKGAKEILTASDDNNAKICLSAKGINEWVNNSKLADIDESGEM